MALTRASSRASLILKISFSLKRVACSWRSISSCTRRASAGSLGISTATEFGWPCWLIMSVSRRVKDTRILSESEFLQAFLLVAPDDKELVQLGDFKDFANLPVHIAHDQLAARA